MYLCGQPLSGLARNRYLLSCIELKCYVIWYNFGYINRVIIFPVNHHLISAMKNKLFLIILLVAGLNAQSQNPHLAGEIRISIQSGIIEADLLLSNLPNSDNYSILLNRGLNVQYFRDIADSANYSFRFDYDRDVYYEGFQYQFPVSGNERFPLPEAFMIRYAGKFPVFGDTLRAYEWGDWKGNIAFNGQSLRAAEQSGWYPILFDQNTATRQHDYTYDVTISCTDCSAIYFNGSEPVKGQQANFRSETPVPLMLFAGSFDFSVNDHVLFVNSGLRPEKQKTLVDLTDRVIEFYEEKLRIPYGSSLVFLNTTPVSKRNAWMFVTYPTIATVGRPGFALRDYFDPVSFQIKDPSYMAMIAHELGHYYIGTYFRPNDKLFWFFLEGLTDYMSLHAIRHVGGDALYKEVIGFYTRVVQNYEPVSLNLVEKPGEIDEYYRYRYAPLMLAAIEKEIGEEAMWEWMREVIESGGQLTDYGFLLSSFAKAGIPQETIDYLVAQYIESDQAKQNVLAKLAE